MQNNPLLLLIMGAISGYVIYLWFADVAAAGRGNPNPRALPGATHAPARGLLIGAAGALLILAAETKGELWLGVSGEQSNLTVLFATYTLLAAFVEEIIFRGFLVLDNRGDAARWLAVLAASILFAALHPFLWDWKNETFAWHFNAKGWFSTGIVFTSSLWFYFMRFASFNPRHSLAPCFAAHLTKNLGVIIIKAVQGHLAGLY